MQKVASAFAAILCFAAAACTGALDLEQADLCRRVLPALHPDTSEIREVRMSPDGPRALRIDYAAREPGSELRNHFALCRFGEERRDLAALETDRGPIGEARLFFLKRNWLAPFAPGAELQTAPPPVPEIPLSLAYALQQGINALALAAIYGLLATSYSLVYGLIGRINLVFGDLAVIGAYGAIGGVAAIVALGAGDPIAGLTIAFAVAAGAATIWSWLIGQTVVAPLHASFRAGQPILIATAAASLFIQEFLRLFQGVRERWLPPFFTEPLALARAGRFVVTVTTMQILVSVTAAAAAVALLLLLARTRLGREWRAFADDPGAASLFGVAPERILGATFIFSGLSAGLAGWIVAVYYGNVSFSMGTALALKSLLAAIIGGIGRVEGALAGGILIGLVEAIWSAYFDIGMRDIVVFTLLIVLFVLRPGGLLGFAGPSPREV